MTPVAARATIRKEAVALEPSREPECKGVIIELKLGQLLRFTGENTAKEGIPMFCETLSFSAGRARSRMPAATRAHFIIGAQKNTVFGPNRVSVKNGIPLGYSSSIRPSSSSYEIALEDAGER